MSKEKKINNVVKTFIDSVEYEKVESKLTEDMTVSDEKTLKGVRGRWVSYSFASDSESANEVVMTAFDALTDEETSAYAFEQFYIRFQDKKRLELQSTLGLIEGNTGMRDLMAALKGDPEMLKKAKELAGLA